MSIAMRLFLWCLSAEAWGLRVVAHGVEGQPNGWSALRSRINLDMVLEEDSTHDALKW
jgi:hypothetical protein